jgi:F-type H+-transporting ATPase subunit alpha
MYPESVLQRYEEGLYNLVEKEQPEILREICEKKTLDADLEKKIKAIMEKFKGQFKVE